jgi:hypothetical protein
MRPESWEDPEEEGEVQLAETADVASSVVEVSNLILKPATYLASY